VLARVHAGCPGKPPTAVRQFKSVHGFERGTEATATALACNAIGPESMKNDALHGLALCGMNRSQAFREAAIAHGPPVLTRFRVGPFAHYSLTEDRIEETRRAIRQHIEAYQRNATLWSRACIHYSGRRNASLSVAQGGVAPQAWGMQERSGYCVDYELILRVMLQIHHSSERAGPLDTNLCQPRVRQQQPPAPRGPIGPRN
jgi:hypothetical protein